MQDYQRKLSNTREHVAKFAGAMQDRQRNWEENQEEKNQETERQTEKDLKGK